MSIYQEIILHEYKNPRHYGQLSGVVATVTVQNLLFCDKLTFYARVIDGKLEEITYEGVGCAISIASASLLTDSLIGKTVDDVKKTDTEAVVRLLGVKLSPNRLKCALLPLEGVQKVIDGKKK